MIGTAPRAAIAWMTRNAEPAENATFAVDWVSAGVTISGVLTDADDFILNREMLSSCGDIRFSKL